MVELIRNRGAFVVEVRIPQLIEMFEVMAELEAMCGRLCARRITAELSVELRRPTRPVVLRSEMTMPMSITTATKLFMM